MLRIGVVVLAFLLLPFVWGSGESFEFCTAGSDSIGFFNNLTGARIDGLILRFSSPIEPGHSVGVGGDMTISANSDGVIVYRGQVVPQGVWEVDWASEVAQLESAAWLIGDDIVQEIDVHVPTARFTMVSGPWALSLRFAARGSIDPDGLPLQRYVWEFSDGVIVEGFEIVRSFPTPGRASVRLTVWDSEGKSATREQPFTVRAEPTVPPSPYRIAFTAWIDGQREILVINEDGTGLVRLTDSTSDDWGPQWSPDGTQIAFYSDRGGSGRRIYMMDADGSNQRMLVDISLTEFDWGPDGTIVFNGPSSQLYTVQSDGSDLRLVHSGSWSAPTISPDGQTIAGHAYTTIPLVDADGTNYRTIPNPEGYGSRLFWRYDSQYGGWHGHVYVQIVDTLSGDRRTIAEFPGSGKPGAVMWDPSGDMVVTYNPVGDSASGITYIYDFDGNTLKEYDNEIVRPWDWSPDSDTLAVLAYVEGVYFLAAVDLLLDEVHLLYPNVDAPGRTASRARYER